MGCRLGQPQHCSACRMYSNTLRRPRTMNRPSAFDFRRYGASFMLIVTVLDIQERFVLISSISTFCNWIPHCVLNQMPLSCSGPTAHLSTTVLVQRHCMHVTPQYSAMRPRSAFHRRAVPRPTCTSCHHSSSVRHVRESSSKSSNSSARRPGDGCHFFVCSFVTSLCFLDL